jgi:predicted RNA-binding protein YlxR (DUF448 family)
MPTPERTCIGCGSRLPKDKLTRVVAADAGGVVLDLARRLPGRGAYLCGSACVATAVKRRAFGRAFRRQMNVVGEELIRQMEAGRQA